MWVAPIFFLHLAGKINTLGIFQLADIMSAFRSKTRMVQACFTIKTDILALVQKHTYVDHFLSCRRFGDEPPR
jgi:hypothetical protein